MADNIQLDSGTGGDVLAADDIGGTKHQRVKIQHGADGAATDVSSASPLPVDGSGVTQPVSAASLPLPSGAATAANQSTANTALAAIQTAVELLDNMISGSEGQVDVVTSALPTGAATEATLGGVNTRLGEVSATPTANTALARLKTIGDTLSSLLTELQAKADLAETQPVSAASLPLPTGAATEASLSNVDTNTADLPNAIGTDGSAGPSKAVSVAGTDGLGNLQEFLADTDGHLQADVLSSALPTGAATETTVDAIKTAVELIDNAISGSEMQVDVVTSALPTGAATAANQSTGNTALAAIQTAVEILDNIVSGSEAQVDIVGSLPAGTNAIGKLAANSGVDIGDVDVTSLPALVAGSAVIGKVQADFPSSQRLTQAAVNISSSGDNTIVAAVASQSTRVHGLLLVADTPVDVTVKTGTTSRSGPMRLGALYLPPGSTEALYKTANNEAFILNLSAAVQVSGTIWYETSA